MSEIGNIEKKTSNRFLNFYEFEAIHRDGRVSPYYVSSRAKDIPGEASSLHFFIFLRAGHIVLSYAYHAMILTSATKQHAAEPIII